MHYNAIFVKPVFPNRFTFISESTHYQGIQLLKSSEFYETVRRNHEALLTMGKPIFSAGFVMSTLNKLPQERLDIVRTDNNWENWNIETLIKNLQAWQRRNKQVTHQETLRETPKRERHWFATKGSDQPRERAAPSCMYCKEDHQEDNCTTFATVEARRKFFHDNQLCYSCGKPGHPASKCRSRGCYKCKGRHHTSICDRESDPVLTAFTPKVGGANPSSHNTCQNQWNYTLDVLRHRRRKKLSFRLGQRRS